MEWYQEPNLAKTFYEIIQIDTDLEASKRALAMHCDYNFVDASRMFDLPQRGQVSRLQLEEVFALHKLFPSSEEIRLIMLRYDRDRDTYLSVKEELANFILPRDENYRDMCMKRKVFAADLLRQNYFARAQCFLPDT